MISFSFSPRHTRFISRVLITSRSTPSSGNSTLVPFPSTNGRAPNSSARLTSNTSSSPLRGNAMRRAAPPMRNDVYRRSGTSFSYAMSGR